jgi:hypothetical protein
MVLRPHRAAPGTGFLSAAPEGGSCLNTKLGRIQRQFADRVQAAGCPGSLIRAGIRV